MDELEIKKYKTCVVCLARKEEYYLREFIEHYINKYKFDHVFIIDNNDNDDRLDINNVLNDEEYKALKEHVTVVHYNENSSICNIQRDYNGYFALMQNKMYDDVILKDYHLDYIEHNIKYNIKDNYDYVLTCDTDEFIEIYDKHNKKNIICINDFINNYIIKNNFTNVSIPWIIYTDNNMLKKDLNKPVQERFITPTYKEVSNVWNIRNGIYDDNDYRKYFDLCKNELSWVKLLFRTKGIKHIDTHSVSYEENVDVKDNISEMTHFNISDYIDGHYDKIPDVVYYLKHYRTKSPEEYIEHKVMQNNIKSCNIVLLVNSIIIPYFYFNTINTDKLIKFCSLYKKHNLSFSENDKHFILDNFNDPRYSPLTIVIRTHNRLDKLKECISHIELQTMKANVLVGCDNCTDGTPQYLNDYISNSNNKLSKHLSYFVSQRPTGPGSNTNILLNMLRTKFYIMIDDDDYYMYDKVIECIYNTIINNPDYLQYQFNPSNIKDKSFTWSHVYYVLPTDYIVNSYKVTSEYCNDDWYFRAIHYSFYELKMYDEKEKYDVCYVEIPKEDLNENNEIDIYKYRLCGELGSYNKSVTYDITYGYYDYFAKKNLLKNFDGYTDDEIIEKSKKDLDLIVNDFQYKIEQSIHISTLKEYFMLYINNIPVQDRQYYYDKFLYM